MLGKTELRDIKRIASFYDKFVLVLNIAAPIDMSELCDAEDINAVLLIGQGGSESGSACADIISGKSSPSGKLTSTWARKYSDYPLPMNLRDSTEMFLIPIIKRIFSSVTDISIRSK